MTDVKDSYSSYVHICNSGFEVSVDIERTQDSAAQFLTTSLHSFGMPHITRMWIDDNVLDAMEYVIAKARAQRRAFPELSHTYGHTDSAIPPNEAEARFNGQTGTQEASE